MAEWLFQPFLTYVCQVGLLLQTHCCESEPGFFLCPVKPPLFQTLSPMYLLQIIRCTREKCCCGALIYICSEQLQLPLTSFGAKTASTFEYQGSGVLCLYLLKTLPDSNGYSFARVCVKRNFNVGSVTSVSPTRHLLPCPKCLFNVVFIVTWFFVERGTSKETKDSFENIYLPLIVLAHC